MAVFDEDEDEDAIPTGTIDEEKSVLEAVTESMEEAQKEAGGS